MLKNFSLNKLKIFSGSTLKSIAVITMLIDHAALTLFSQLDFAVSPIVTIGSKSITLYYIMRKIGRLAFPIFCFLITEGFLHTRNKKRYGINLLLFALISEIPFDLMVGGRWLYIGKQNIYFTLFLGFLCLYLFEKVKEQPKLFIGLFLTVAAAAVLNVDYGVSGVILILLIYIMRNSPALQAILSYPMLSGGIAAFAAFIPINMYNGKRGFIKNPIIKYGFYLFYPLHIILLLIVKKMFL